MSVVDFESRSFGLGDSPSTNTQGGTYDPSNPMPGQYIEANGGRFYLLGDNPTTGAPQWSSFVSAKSGTLVINGRLVDADTGQVLADFSNTGGGGGVSATTAYAQQQQNLRDQAQTAELARQFNEKLWMDKARGDQEQRVAQGTLAVNQGNLAVNQGRLGLDTQQQLIDWYNRQAERFANPRNFAESLFYQRNRPAPVGAEASAIGRSLGQFYGRGAPAGMPVAPVGAPAAAPAAQPVAQPYARTPEQQTRANASGSTGYASPYEGLSGFNKDGTLRLAANDPDAAGLMAKYPGRYRIGFDRGGVVPEPVVGRGVISGQQYTFGEKGPEGVVPTEYLPQFLKKRHGRMMGARSYAIGGEIGYDPALQDPYSQDPMAPTTTPLNDPTNPYSDNFDPYASYGTDFVGPITPYGSGAVMTPGVDYYSSPTAPHDTVTTTATPQTGVAPLPTATTIPFDWTAAPAPEGFHWENGRLVQNATTMPPATTTPTTAPSRPRPTPIPVVSVPQGPTTTGPTTTGPTGVPAVYTAPPPGTPTPRETSSAGTFGGLSGRRPQFLPGEDNGQTTLQALLSANALPPFLSRLFAQSRGVQSEGTNMPQDFNLPTDVPLPSRLAWMQMTPDEQQALLSYASSYGVTPETFLSAIQSFAPQGGPTQSPLFGNAVSYYRQ